MTYLITNLINGSLFFGFDSKQLTDRAKIHDDLGTDIRKYGIENFEYQILKEPLSLVEAKRLFKSGTYGNVPNYMGWTADPYIRSVTATRTGNKIHIRIDTNGVEYAQLSGTLSGDKVRWFKEYNRPNRCGTSTREFREKLRDSNSDEIALIVNGRWHKKTIELPHDIGVTIKGDDLTFYFGTDVFHIKKPWIYVNC
ncbi:group I intron endonuclease [Acetobacter orientalis]|uniref:Group I intron endonuclease n=1 Tax=Acetobacter orientalis TaxID=146474 RepID=A0A2Z5ZJI1_9PROT|nr:group I intron endonuclease [Acetobacter orientalis]